MKVIVDTSVWSLALRRRSRMFSPQERLAERQISDLIDDGRAALIGPVRQELLTGIRESDAFSRLRLRLRAFTDEALTVQDYETAAEFSNMCLAVGIAGSSVDLLICAVAARRDMEILTLDRDFERYAMHLPVRLQPLQDNSTN